MRVAKNGPVIACALSGGIDSLISAKILKEKVYMKNWDSNEDLGYCTGGRDLRDAENVCKILDIPFHVANFVQDYWHNVFQPVLNDFKDGYYTPNPDILCNSQIKFGSFLQYCIKELQVVAIATGHYAGNSWPAQKVLANSKNTSHYDDVNYVTTLSYSDQPKLLEAAGDSVKDQSFFLANINTLALSKSIFPLSIHTKDAVKSAICHDPSLAPIWARRPESQGICFVGKREKFDRFLAQYLGHSVGSHQKNKALPRIVDIENKGHLIGHLKDHVIDVPSFNCETADRKNILSTPFVTIGQRIPHSRIQFETSMMNNNRLNGQPFYVVYKCKYSSDIYVSKAWNHPLLYSTLFITEPAHWINNDCTTIFQNDNINSFSNQNAAIGNKSLFLRQNNRKKYALYFRHVNIEAKYPCNLCTISNTNQMEFLSVLQRAIFQNGPQYAKFEHFYHVICDEFEKNFCTTRSRVNLNNNFKYGGLIVQTKYPSRAITPGQYAVFYEGNVCLGCARIKFVIPNFEEIDD